MKTSVKIEDTLDKMVMETLQNIFPEFSKLIEEEVKKVYVNAKQNWLVRDRKSRRSVDKLEFGVQIQGGKIVGFVKNMAPYAYAIKVGVKSDTYLPLGKRLADELITKPMTKMSKKLNNKLVEEFIKIQG
tara:strand:- start:282 stop:671 length:390 start_codon:yes stop_codon:yes gene_type:complete